MARERNIIMEDEENCKNCMGICKMPMCKEHNMNCDEAICEICWGDDA